MQKYKEEKIHVGQNTAGSVWSAPKALGEVVTPPSHLETQTKESNMYASH